MAKKKTDDFPKYEDWKAPWEVDAEGKDIPEEEQKFDAERARKLIYARTADLHRKSTALDETTASKEELEQQIAEATDPEKVKQLQKQIEDQQAEIEKAKKDTKTIRLEVALDKGLTKRQAMRLVGETREELEEDADELLKEFGGRGKTGEEGEGNPNPRKAPKQTVRTNGDPLEGYEPDEDQGKDPDPEKLADAYFAMR